MGKSLGFKYAGKGPGLQKTRTLTKKYLCNQTKKGKLSDLDFDVEQAPKLSAAEADTGLKGNRAPDPDPTPAPEPKKRKAKKTEETAEVSAVRGSSSALGAMVVGERPVSLAEKVGRTEWERRIGNAEQDKAAREEMAAKKAAKRQKKCAPV
mmetsp:Transcript_45420/g.106703  ORF Transcript_45420/g.106703 Transcript_45420/m.106703 type:complete len:152 (+) Transcript_45420:3-458(+)